MFVRTTVAGVWLAVICSIAAPSAGRCEVKTLPHADAALAAPSPADPTSGGERAHDDLSGFGLGELTFSAQPRAGTSAAQDLRGAPLSNVVEPPQSLWRRLLSAIVQLGAARASP